MNIWQEMATIGLGSTALAGFSLGLGYVVAQCLQDRESINDNFTYATSWNNIARGERRINRFRRLQLHYNDCSALLLPHTKIMPIPKWRRRMRYNLHTGARLKS